jgi:hypothetical protein
MAGLSNFISNSATQSTTMPTWYDQAQQNVVNQATTGAGNVPTLANTVAGGAINQLSNPATNPFTQAQSTLGQIGSGAANPWITDSSGAVTPNTNTAMGGLFAAQNQELNQLLPQYTAPVEGANIASGNFGSLRGETAMNKAKADAFAQLLPAQMQAALQNQQTGVQAGTAQGQVGSQGVTSMTNLGQAQQSDPMFAASALGKIVGGINAPTTTKNETQLSPLNQIGSVASALGGSISGTDKLLQQLGLGGLSQFFGKTNAAGATPIDTATGTRVNGVLKSYGSPVTGTGIGGGPGLGQVLGKDGNVYKDPSYGAGSNPNNNVTPEPPPPGAVDQNGNPNPGWAQDQSGSWYQTGGGNVDTGGGNVDTGGGNVDTGDGTVDTGGGNVDTGSSDWWG